jgi:DNA-binding SARP family transcriptional activator
MPVLPRGLTIRVLGPLEVSVEGAPLVVDTRKALAIVALLAVERRTFARDELAALLWPEADDESARGALRRTLSVLRTALGDRWLITDRSAVRLEPPPDLDLAAFEVAAAADDVASLRVAADLARGPFLAGFGLRDSPGWDDWRAARESALERAVGDVLDRLADALSAAGDDAGAADIAARRVERDPLDEAAHRRLMLSLARTGDRAAAIRQYRACVAVLERELGVPPLDETTALYEAIRDGRVAMVEVPPRAAAPTGGAELAQVSASPFIGRDAELGRLLADLAASRPDGRLAVVEGEAGIGKTRLLDELGTAARRTGTTVLATCAYAAEAGIPYGVVVELLRAAHRDEAAAQRLERLPDAVRAELSRLVDLGPAPAPPAADGPGAKARLLAAIAEGLTAAVDGSVAGSIVVDDVHAADEASREALAWLARRLIGRPVLLVLAWRPEDLDAAGSAFAASLAGIVATRLPLERLDPDDALALATALHAAETDAAGIRTLAARAEGLPLYLVEAAAGDGAASDAAPPAAMATLVRERLATLGGSTTQVLAAAAVIGRSFEPGTVRQASGRSEDEVVDALDELLARGLVRELGIGGDGEIRYDFAHGLIRDVVYDGTSLARRRLLHRRVADAFRTGPRGRDDVGRLARIASHEQAAGRDTEAAEAFREAGIGAAELLASSEAIAHLETALALGHPDRADLHRRIGELRTREGDYPDALRSLEAGAALAGGPELAVIERALAVVQLRRGDAAAADGHLSAALVALAGGRDVDRAVLLADRAVVAIRAGRPAVASAHAAEALALAQTSEDRPTRILAQRVAGLAARASGDLGGATRALEASLALATQPADVSARVAARNALALVAVGAGRRDEAVGHAQAALADVRSIGDRHLEAVVENTLADALHAAGRDDESLDHLKRAVALFAEIGGTPAGPAEPEPGIWALETW